MIDYSQLQNGSDIRGIALEGVPGETPNLDQEAVFRLTRGFLLWLSTKTKKEISELTIAIGHDSRLSAEAIKKAAINTMLPLGVKVYDAHMASTPAMFMTTVFDEYQCDGSIMITASHLPFNRNGFKYFDKEGGLNKGDISQIISYAQSDSIMETMFPHVSKGVGTAIDTDLISVYAGFLREKIINEVKASDRLMPLKGLKIMVDAGNGAGGFYAAQVLAPLGADVSSSQFLEPDGTFPNHMPNPENKEAMAIACAKVKASNVDLGLIFDTDVDRASAIDKDGNEINRDRIVALAAALIAREHPGTTVVTDSITSNELTDYLENCLGLKHLRFKRGYKNVINKSLELNKAGADSQLAIETSGHAAYKENYFLDDGAYLATKIVIKAAQLKAVGEDISCMIAPLKMPKEAIEKRFPIQGKDFAQVGEQVLSDLESWEMIDGQKVKLVTPNYEGVRLDFDMDGLKGWCLLRKSLHDPIMPLNIQVTSGSCREILSMIEDFLKDYPQVDIG